MRINRITEHVDKKGTPDTMTNISTRTNAMRLIKAAVLIASAALMVGCDAVIDCFDNDGPVFSNTTLEPATLNQVYSHSIGASVKNELFDDRFDYDFTLLSGSLPPGITAVASGQRNLLITGTATELGTYTFVLNVFVDDGLNATDSNLCYRNRDREFQLVVKQDGA